MKTKSHPLLFVLLTLGFASCHSYSGDQDSVSIRIDTVFVNDLEILVTTESALLGEPREIVALDDHQIAVYDHAYQKIMLFDINGEKLHEFGNVGEGPGEWDSMSGAADLNFVADRFFTTNRGRLLFDIYDRSGSHLRTIPFPQYLNYSHKTLLTDDKLLVTTDGREQALAVVMDLNNDGNIIHRIGSPESEYSEGRNFEQERMAYANGEIPENDLNNALAAKGKGGYFIFMNTLGELRHYSEDGKLIFQQEIPEAVKSSVFDFIVDQNKNEVPQHTVMPLEYARGMKVHNGLIYLFMPKPHPAADEIDYRMLVYNTAGELMHHYVFSDPDDESFLYDFAISSDNSVYFIDVMQAEILRFMPDSN